MVSIDLFDLVDGLFRGVVYFFYNIFDTIGRLVRRPLRGALGLYRRRRRPGVRQLAGPTFLFLSFFGFFATHWMMGARFAYGDAQASIGSRIREAMATPPAVDADWLWLVFVTSLASTIVVDLVLRAILSSRAFGRRTRRLLILESAEYALFWPIALLLVFSLWLPTFETLAQALYEAPVGWTFLWADAPVLPPLAAVPLIVTPLVAALLPAALILAAGPREAAARRRRTVRLAALLVAAAAMVAGTFAGAVLGADIIGRRYEEEGRVMFASNVVVLDLSCALAGPDPHVDAIVWNRGAEPLVHLPSVYTLYIAEDEQNFLSSEEEVRRAHSYLVAFEESAPSTILIQPGEARSVRLLVPDYQYTQADAGRRCGLKIERPEEDALAIEDTYLRSYIATIP